MSVTWQLSMLYSTCRVFPCTKKSPKSPLCAVLCVGLYTLFCFVGIMLESTPTPTTLWQKIMTLKISSVYFSVSRKKTRILFKEKKIKNSSKLLVNWFMKDKDLQTEGLCTLFPDAYFMARSHECSHVHQRMHDNTTVAVTSCCTTARGCCDMRRH